MKRAIITGATSLIGVELVKACIRNDIEVIALVRKGSSTVDRLPVSPMVRVVTGDLEELHLLDGEDVSADLFFHMGWQGTSKEGRKDPLVQEKNIAYTLDAVNLAHRAHCSVFVGAGSQAEYGLHQDAVTTPDSPVSPQEAYGIAKYASGRLAALRAAQLKIRFVWVRIFSVYGKYEASTSMIQTALRKMLSGDSCLFSAATQNWDYLHAEDAGKAILALGMSEKAEGIYCLGKGEAHPLKEFILQMKEITHSDSELVFSKDPVPAGRGFAVDISKLQRDTGWEPVVDFDEGIQKTIEWIMSENNNETV